jgi:hypothetical protein
MCNRYDCKEINIIEGLPNNAKMFIHYNADMKPILIEYDNKIVFHNRTRKARKAKLIKLYNA